MEKGGVMRNKILVCLTFLIIIFMSFSATPHSTTSWVGKVNGISAIAVSGGSGLMTASQIKQYLLTGGQVSSIGSVSISGDTVTVTNIVIQDVNISQVTATPSADTSTAYMLLSDLKAAFLTKNPDIKSVNVSFVGNNLVNVVATVKLGFISLNLNLTGQMFIQNGGMYYTCTQAQMNGLGVSKKVVNAILTRTNPFFKFSNIPIPTYFNTISYGSDKIILSTTNN